MFVITAVIFSVLLTIFLILNLYWTHIFIGRIRRYRKYKKRAVKNVTDEESGEFNQHLTYYYQTEIRKNVLLFLINFTEMFGCIIYYLMGMTHFYIVDNNFYNVTIQPYMNECSTTVNISVLNQLFQNPQVFPYINWLDAIGNSADLFVPTFGICLMHYLIFRMKEIDYPHTRFLCLFLTLTAFLSGIIITTATVPYLYLISTAFYIISISLYFVFFVKISYRFKRALLQLALQRLTQTGKNVREMKQYKYFKYSMNIISIGFFFIVVGDCLSQFERASIYAIFFAKCYFPFNFLPPITFLVQSEYAAHIFLQILFFAKIISECIMSIGLLFWLLPFVMITVYIWIMQIYTQTHKPPKIKYTTVNSLQEPLMMRSC